MTKLWESSSPSFKLRRLAGWQEASFLNLPGLVALYWPSGECCWPVTAYLVSLCLKNRKASTANTYGSELSHLIRFVSKERISFTSITEDRFCSFSSQLTGDAEFHTDAEVSIPEHAEHRSRKNRQVNRILLRSIAFLKWYQVICLTDRVLVGDERDDPLISIETTYSRHGGRVVAEIKHAAQVPNNVPAKVRPMATPQFDLLLETVASAFKTSFVKARNKAILKLLFDSGIRREEAVWVTVEDVRLAKQVGGKLQVRTSKRDGNPRRVVQVPMITIQALVAFADVQRTIKAQKSAEVSSSTWLFCAVDGSRLAPATVTQMFATLRRAAGISVKACAHMLRHRWITMRLADRLDQLVGLGAIGVEMMTTILTRLASETGHGSIGSLFTYVDPAFDELKTRRVMDPQSVLDAKLKQLVQEVQLGASGERIDELLLTITSKFPRTDKVQGQSVTSHSMRSV